MSVAITECGDFSDFQESLKKMRRLDDLIVNTLNSALPTDSFHPNGERACRDLYESIEKGNANRIGAIRNCITVTADRVRQLRERREANDISVQKELRLEQTKLRMLKVELSVEDLVQQRTGKVFAEKCRSYFRIPK